MTTGNQCDETQSLMGISIDQAKEALVITELKDQVTDIQGQVTEIRGEIIEMKGEFTEMKGKQDTVQGTLNQMRGDTYQSSCAREIAAILADHYDYAQLVDRDELRRQLVTARQRGIISRPEMLAAVSVDIVATDSGESQPPKTYAVAEASITFNLEDALKAQQRALTIEKVTGMPTQAFVITHHEWPQDIEEATQALGVTILQFPADRLALR